MPDTNPAVAAAADLMDALDPALDVVVGYRTRLVAGGIAPDIADEMARYTHHRLVDRILPGPPIPALSQRPRRSRT